MFYDFMSDLDVVLLNYLKVGLFHNRIALRADNSNGDIEVVYSLAKKQTVLGVVFDGIQMLDTDHRPNKSMLLDWFAKSILVERVQKTDDTHPPKRRYPFTQLLILAGVGKYSYFLRRL